MEAIVLPLRDQLMVPDLPRMSSPFALYWLSRITDFGPDMNRWAVSGLRILLGGKRETKL